MKHTILITLVFMALACRPDGSKNRSATQQDHQQVEAAIRGSIAWAATKDTSLLYSIILADSTYLEVQPEARIVKGNRQFREGESFWLDPRFKAIRYEIRDLTIRFSQKREVAWFYCRLDDMNEWDGRPANWENVRWTGVLEKHGDSWKMMQMHFSYDSK